MGQYVYLINKEERICCEAYKIGGGGTNSLEIESPKTLTVFMEYCRENSLQIECVSEHWFEANVDLATEQAYTDFIAQAVDHVGTLCEAMKSFGATEEEASKAYRVLGKIKTYEKSKFWFVHNNGTKKDPKNGEVYFRYEWRVYAKFPFIFKELICYKLIDNIWVEQPK